MQRASYAIILAAFILLGGCRSRETSNQSTKVEPTATVRSTPTPARASAKALDNRPLLVCFGDSLTEGYGTEAGQSYPDYLQDDLDALGYHYQVVNEGVSGATSKDGVTRVEGIAGMKPAVVIVEFGGNDGLRGQSVNDIRANLDKIVSTLKASGAKVVLAGISLPPDYGPDYVTQFTAIYPQLAKKYHIPVLPFLLQGVFGVEGMMQQDLTHATSKGNKVVAQNLLPVILPVLKKG